jgi:hypothetical protein
MTEVRGRTPAGCTRDPEFANRIGVVYFEGGNDLL